MRPAATVRVRWTRAELLALREAIEVTPNFEGRQELRDFFRTAVHAHRLGDLELEFGIAERLSNRLVPVDLATATARRKLVHAVRGAAQTGVAGVRAPPRARAAQALDRGRPTSAARGRRVAGQPAFPRHPSTPAPRVSPAPPQGMRSLGWGVASPFRVYTRNTRHSGDRVTQ